MKAAERNERLARGRRGPLWPGEPLLGSYYSEEEIETVTRVIRDSMDPTVGFGFICEEIEEFERAFAGYCGTRDAVSINGAGTGLDMAMMALRLSPEDEVIVPSINFRAALLAVVGQGAKLIVCEVDPRTLNADPEDVERRVTKNTRAIFPVHMNGLSAPMDDYLDIAERHPHPKYGPPMVIGDAARACGGGYKGTKIGKKGWMNVFSFHTQKMMTTLGEGGAVTTDDPELARELRGFRQFGGANEGWGSNYKMTKVQAAVGLVQLKKLDEMVGARRRIAHDRTEMLQDIEELTLPFEPEGCEHSFYLYTCLVPEEWAFEKRERVREIMRDQFEVNTVVANPPAHRQFPFLSSKTAGQDLPVSEVIGGRLFCVPIHPRMTDEDNAYICAALSEAVVRVREDRQ